MHSATQAAIAQAVLGRRPTMPAGLRATQRRFGLYRANVAAALVGALATRFPVSSAIVGEEFFRAMAAEFVRVHPPRSPVLLDYGAELPAFAAAFEPAQDIVYLADLMRLEIARSEAFHAADAEPAGTEYLAALDPALLAQTRVSPHPAARLLACDHPVATIAAMHAPGEIPRAIEPWCGEAVLVTRPRFAVLTQILAPGAFSFLSQLFGGSPIADAVEAALAAAPDFDAGAGLAALVTSGAALNFNQGALP